MIYTATILPFRLSFMDVTNDGWDTWDRIINYFFMFDVLVNLMSAYYDQDNLLVTNNIYIAKNYMRGWMIVDIISVIPFSDIMEESNSQYNNLIRLMRLPRLYRLIRVLRLIKVSRSKNNALFKLFKPFLSLDVSIRRMIKIMFLSLLFIHLSACFYFLITKVEDAPVTWVSNLNLEDADLFTQYVRALYWSL
jgi:hypothetical protein